ncbi:tail length tape measure protein [Rhizobium phage RHEph10]|uniref:tail length tape measure protein n=1 Tax=Rhizobium phage RHEph10 TaxID=1220717 RepID=UPI0002AB0F7E|nr:tail length tape measure protein [Rhizobium phage RHEph10]AGC36057.1 putative tail tape measure protein [Rhizobium phage RHEph10]
MLHAGETIEQFNRNVARSSPALRRMAQDGTLVIRSMEKAQEAGKGFLSTLRDVSIVTTAVSVGFNKIINIQDTWIGAVVRTNAEFQRLTTMLRGMSDAADPIKDAAGQLDNLVNMAKEAPFSLDKIADSFTKLKATGTDPMKGSLQAIMDGVAHFGKDGEALERTVLGISQASGKGVIQMEELRQQIGESLPQAMGLMAASMGVSMASLVKHISTGRMAAGPALDAFYQELDRSFGGDAARMMQTFGGQIARTKTELQEFAQIIGGIDKATGEANKGGFFDTVTEQVRALNEALASSGGQVFAQQIGQSLASVAKGLQYIIEKAIEFRSAIGNMVEFAAWIAGLKIAASVMSSVSAGYTTLTRGLDMIKLKFADANTMLSAHQNALRNTAVGYESVDRIARMQAAVGMRAVASAAMSIVPVAGVLGLAIYEIADAFDIFGNRGREAIETLREFGDVAKDQLPNAQKDIARRQADLAKEMAQIRYGAEHAVRFGKQSDRKAAIEDEIKAEMEKADIAGRQAQIDRDNFLLKEAQNKALEQDAKKASELALRDLDRQAAADQRAYQIKRENIQKEMDDRVAKAKVTGEKIEDLDKERAAKLMANAAELYTKQQEQLQSAVNDLWAKNGTGPMQLTNQLQLDELLKRIDETREKMSSLRVNGTMPDLGQTSNAAKQLDSLQKVFDRTNDDVAGLEDKLNGANDELGEFLAKLARGAYGNPANEQVQALAASITELMKRKAALEEMNKGANDLQTDIENARMKILEKRVELEEKARGRELTEGEKIQMKLEQGGYKGLGPNSPAMTALSDAIKGLTLQGRVTDALGTSIDKTFGQTAADKITTLNDVLSRTLGIMTGIGSSVNGVDFSRMSQSLSTLGTGGMNGPLQGMMGFSGAATSGANLMSKNMGVFGDPRSAGWKDNNITSVMTSNGMTVQVHKAAADAFKGFLDELIGSGYKIKSLGGYNLRDKVSGKGLSEHAFGNAIDINPEQNPYGSKLITDMPANIREMAAKHGLSWGGDWKSVKDAMHFEWKGSGKGEAQPPFDINNPFYINNPFAGSSVTDTSAVYAEGNVYLEKRNQLLAAAKVATEGLTEEENKLNEDTKAQAGVDKKTELVRMIDEAKESLDGLDKNYRAVSKLIAAGKFGDKSPETAQNKELLRLAQELDAAEKKRADRKEASGNIENNEIQLKQQELALQRQIEELKAKAKNPNVRLESNGLIQLRDDMDKYLRDVETVYTKDSEQYRAAIDKKHQALSMFGQTELLEDVSRSNQKTRNLQQSLMTEAQARRSAMQQELDQVDQRVAYYKQAGLLDVSSTEQFEAEKAAIRQKYAAQDPMSAQMREWSDLQGNLAKASTQWTDSLADGLAGLVTGTGDLKSMMQSLQQIAQQIVSMFIKKMMSGMMSGKTGAGGMGGKASKGAKGASGAGGKAAKATVGMAHTGAMLGQGVSMSRVVNPNVFKNARKFHSGANKIGGRRLLPGEVPIIAKKDEGIFTKEQMAAMGNQMSSGGGSQTISINAPVTVNANGGTPEQNADLAKQIGAQMEGTMRGVVIDEISRQMRPGNMLSAGKGR